MSRPGHTHGLPTGTVTFLFTDIEGSTELARDLGDRWAAVLEQHNRILRQAIRDNDGVDLRTEGDAFFAVFTSAVDALSAAGRVQRAVAGHPWPAEDPVRVRIGMHTGEGRLGGDEYVGLDVHRAARIAAAAHGGQVLLSEATGTLVAEALPDGLALRTLGSHRLKDFDEPQPIHQLVVQGLPSDFPAIRTLEVPTNLPTEPTSFVGRDREIEEVTGLLSGEPRLVTLTGPGGSGKTRLALRVASRLLEVFPDGVFFVDLAAITDPELVCPTIRRVIGLRDEGTRPALESLQQYLRDRRTLLVLDNFEQVLEAAHLVAAVLEQAPRLRILATSRAALRLRGEREFLVPPLDLPDPTGLRPEQMSRYASVALFLDRAAAVDPSFALTEGNAGVVAEICARLDGLPLAIELAVARLRLLPPPAILQRLDRSLALLTIGPRDAPDRQRTLHGTIEWSHDLLEAPERTLFRRLSIFSGGWTLEAAEEVTNPGGEVGAGTLEALGSLVDNSLVQRGGAGPPRFQMLQTIREFAFQRLDRDDARGEFERRHAQYYMTLAEAAAPHLRGLDQKDWLDRLELEHDNLRAALGWSFGSGQVEIGLRLVGALWRFWHLHGHLAEGRRWTDAMVAMPSAGELTAVRARALIGAGGMAYWQFDVPAVRRAYQEALSIYEELGDRPGIAEATYNIVFAHGLEGDMPGAREAIERSRKMFEELGDRRRLADSMWVLSLLARLEGDLTTARSRAEESLRLHREVGDRFGMMDSLHMLGRVTAEMGDLETARACFLETLDVHEYTGNRTGIAIALDNLAAQENMRGRPERALRLAGASDAVKESAGGAAPAILIQLPDPREAARITLGKDEAEAAWEEGRSWSLGGALAYAREVP